MSTLLAPHTRDIGRQYAELAQLAHENLEALNGQTPGPHHPYRSLLRKVLRDVRTMPACELRDLIRELTDGLGVHNNDDAGWTWLLLSEVEAVCLRLSHP